MTIFLIFLDALDATYLSSVTRNIIQHYHKQTIALAVVPRVGEKVLLEQNTSVAYFEIADVVHRQAHQGHFQVDLYLKSALPPLRCF